MSSSFLRKTIKDDERQFLIDGRETLGRSFQTLFGPFWVEIRKSFCCATKANSTVILGVTELCFVLGVVKHNSAFSWSRNPHVKKDPSFLLSNNPPVTYFASKHANGFQK